ncbi:hypothetical protein PVAND_000321 [Polypedilum vanderplanki]|uniref:Uncharacterized protein n=1 Tax=Polypedilum vanderplanki TaxID=319348 RepID=A0A9J6BKL0_POLVA|nr:hypothetical protein PVAND_000321 [Polypedilum vanderplanki]
MKQYFLIIFLIYSAFAAPNSIEKEEENGNEIEIEAAQFMPMMGGMYNPMMMGGMGQCGRCSCMGCSIPWMCLPVCNPCCCNNSCNEETTTDKPTEAPVPPVVPDMHGPEDGTPIWLLPDSRPERNFPQFPIRNPRFEPDNFYPPDIIVRL